MSVSEADLKRWLETVQRWDRANSAEKCRDTFACLEELSSFLKDLEKALSEVVRMEQNSADVWLFWRSIFTFKLYQHVFGWLIEKTCWYRCVCLDRKGL